MTKFTKIKAQMKSNAYYIFWGACTFAVMSGQIYVGNGYRRMAETNDAISADINLLVEILTMPIPKTMPVPKYNYEMPILQ
tara:strand:+ start:54 stop:296 length:243 start_codon:yes stop_codon:yes gene_type:complete